MIDYRKLYSELRGPGEVSPEMVFGAKSAEQSGAFRSKHPEIFDADHPLAFSDAQNTAQKAKDKSDELQEAFKAASSGDFESMPKFDRKTIGMQSVGYQKQPFYDLGKGIEDITMREATRGEKLMHSDVGGKMYKSLKEILKTPGLEFSGSGMGGYGGYSGAGAGITSSPQTSTSNVAPYGYTPREITPAEKEQREYDETPWWRKPQDTTPEWLKKKRSEALLKASNDANKK